MTRHLKGQAKPLGIAYEPITCLWFWDCRICPGFPTVGHASGHRNALSAALLHAANSSHHRHVLAEETR